MTVRNRGTALTRAEIELVETLSARWTIHILLVLHTSDAPWRFGEIQEAVSGISNRVLSGRLAGLESSDLVSRNVTATRPVSIAYRLTAQGRRVAGALACLREVAQSSLDS
ncbi:winged helix-turn-helix transcriptional regulator [Streptomyces mirabilis]|uniref:winged helix-turn-helix transcriptional regulator n=1 Tax=Streptomyces mirabilis TaxID=68239 RepID=UPI00340F14C7